MFYFLAFQSTYQAVECAFFNDTSLIDSFFLDKTVASSGLIPAVHAMLTKQHLSLNALSFIAVNRGPAPFTSLRVVIATVNGIQYAQNIPLVGINGFDVFFHEWDEADMTTAIILNAFNNDVYIALKKAGDMQYISGYGKIDAVARFLGQESQGSVRLLGNAVTIYSTILEHCLGDRMKLPDTEANVSSLYHVGLVGYRQWSAGQALRQATQPLYLKGSTETLHIQ